MKLAEALQARADLNKRIAQIRSRLCNNALVQEGEAPGEDPADLLQELNDCIDTLQSLMTAINMANCNTVTEGKTLTALLAKKDCLSLKLCAYRDLVSEASQLTHRATRTEIKILSTINVKHAQKSVDDLAMELRLLDNQIQGLNWSTEL